ncbi:MAG: gliding motility-associated C-terminal domain-containing protein [Chitinophagales bacterium]
MVKYRATLLMALWCVSMAIQAVPVSITSITTTPSLCSNSGTLTINLSGGAPPYQIIITDGPSNAPITYPFTLPNGQNTVSALPSGTYDIYVKDAVNSSDQTQTMIAGNYQPMGGQFTITNNCITIHPTGGKRPYKFAISSNGNTNFGSYQNDSVFCGLCDATYYVRISDSCGNIYTPLAQNLSYPMVPTIYCGRGPASDTVIMKPDTSDHRRYTYTCKNGNVNQTNATGFFLHPPQCGPDTVTATDSCGTVTTITSQCGTSLALQVALICHNCDSGTASIAVQGATGGYTATASVNGQVVQTNNTGIFSGLPLHPANGYTFTVTGSSPCGQFTRVIPNVGCLEGKFTDRCLYDSVMYLRELNPAYYPYAHFPLTFTCDSCPPPHSFTATNYAQHALLPVFSNVLPGKYTVVITDICNNRIVDTVDMRPAKIYLDPQRLSCNDFRIKAFGSYRDVGSNNQPFNGATFHLVDSNGVELTSNTTGYFYNIPDGYWQVFATSSLCDTSDFTGLRVPDFGTFCHVPVTDSTCTRVSDLSFFGSDYAEQYSLWDQTGLKFTEIPPGAGNGIYFQHVPPGQYTIRSDSGCSQSISIPILPVPAIKYTNAVNCLGQQQIAAVDSPVISYCYIPNYLTFALYRADGGFVSKNTTGAFANIDSSDHYLKVFYPSSVKIFNVFTERYDSICAFDSVFIPALKKDNPVIVANYGKSCGTGGTGNIDLQITGGVPPFTLTITGYPNINSTSRHIVFPQVQTGTHTLTVYDYCGISADYSVQVIDTCVPCPVIAKINLADSIFCLKDTVQIGNSSVSATYFSWYADQQFMGNFTDSQLIATPPGRHHLQLIAANIFCTDTADQWFRVDSIKPQFSLGPDTGFCPGQTILIHPHYHPVSWNLPVFTDSIWAKTAGWYWAESRNGCGFWRDSVWVQAWKNPILPLPDRLDLCGDSLFIIGDTLTQPGVTYQWNTGATTPLIPAQVGQSYQVTLTSGQCTLSDSIALIPVQQPTHLFRHINPQCEGDSVALWPVYGTQPVWSSGETTDTLIVYREGLYAVTVQGPCAPITDSVYVPFFNCACPALLPTAFSPNGDGVNDYFQPKIDCTLRAYHFSIYNRWGEQVFDSNTPGEKWDGQYKGQRQLGVFTWWLEYVSEVSRSQQVQSGNVTLLR